MYILYLPIEITQILFNRVFFSDFFKFELLKCSVKSLDILLVYSGSLATFQRLNLHKNHCILFAS